MNKSENIQECADWLVITLVDSIVKIGGMINSLATEDKVDGVDSMSVLCVEIIKASEIAKIYIELPDQQERE